MHIHRPSDDPLPADAPDRRCQLPSCSDRKVKKYKSSLKFRILKQPGYPIQEVEKSLLIKMVLKSHYLNGAGAPQRDSEQACI